MKKRGISILLCILMILSLLPVSVLAATDEQNVTPVSYTHLDVYKRQT